MQGATIGRTSFATVRKADGKRTGDGGAASLTIGTTDMGGSVGERFLLPKGKKPPVARRFSSFSIKIRKNLQKGLQFGEKCAILSKLEKNTCIFRRQEEFGVI